MTLRHTEVGKKLLIFFLPSHLKSKNELASELLCRSVNDIDSYPSHQNQKPEVISFSHSQLTATSSHPTSVKSSISISFPFSLPQYKSLPNFNFLKTWAHEPTFTLQPCSFQYVLGRHNVVFRTR